MWLSRCFLGLLRFWLLAGAPPLASDSVARTLRPPAYTFMAMACCWSAGRVSNALAWPISILPLASISETLSSRSSRRIKLETAARERPTASATARSVISNSFLSRYNAWASSSGLRSSRWIFSIKVTAATALSSISLTMAGIDLSPASCAARQRLSPAISS